jgi:uncharacterized protein involved in exopolysaccharide biosynthesis
VPLAYAYLLVVSKYRMLISAVAIGGALAGSAVSWTRPPLYGTEARVWVAPHPSGDERVTAVKSRLDTMGLAARVLKDLNGPGSPNDATSGQRLQPELRLSIRSVEVVAVEARMTDPALAAAAVNRYVDLAATLLHDELRQETIVDLEGLQFEIRTAAAALTSANARLEEFLAAQNRQLTEPSDSTYLAFTRGDLDVLTLRQRGALREYTASVSRYTRAARLLDHPLLRVVRRAEPPRRPITTHVALNAITGLALALMMAVLVACLLDYRAIGRGARAGRS